MEEIVSNVDVLFHLGALNVYSEFVLVTDDFSLEKSNFLHEILVQLVLVDFDTLFSKQLHLLFRALEYHDLLIFVEDAVLSSVKDIQELMWCCDPQ